MPLNVNNPEADALTRKFAGMLGVGITDAIVIAMKEAIARYGVTLSDETRKPLPRQVFDDMWGDDLKRKG